MGEIQRARILGAMRELVCAQGVGAPVSRVVARAGVSRRTFYELFEDREACLLAALDDALARVSVPVVEAYGAHDGWQEGVRAGLLALLELFDREPVLARFCVVEALGAGPTVLGRRARVMATLIEVVDRGRGEARGRSEPAPLTADGVVGAVFSVIHTRLSQADPEPLRSLLGPLMSMIVYPYLGPAVGRREIARAAPVLQATTEPWVGDPLQGLRMRLTYRTIQVLMVLAHEPGVSNREIAKRAGIVDQGQTSKLLARLQNLGLAQNTGLGSAKGAPNAWCLTDRGRHLENEIRVGAQRT